MVLKKYKKKINGNLLKICVIWCYVINFWGVDGYFLVLLNFVKLNYNLVYIKC